VHGVIVDGQLVALWRREVAGGGVNAYVRPLRPLSTREHREVTVAFDRYGTFAGVPVKVAIA
jgi:hypothetical protein